MTVSTLELAGAVLDWARTPGTHGRIEVLDFVTLAHEVVDKAAYEKHQAEDDARQRLRHGEAIAWRKAANTPWPVDGDTRTPPSPEPLELKFDPETATHAKCGNWQDCGLVHEIGDLDEYRDFWSRISVGSECPAGDCPKCGAFCYVIKMPTRAEAAGLNVV